MVNSVPTETRQPAQPAQALAELDRLAAPMEGGRRALDRSLDGDRLGRPGAPLQAGEDSFQVLEVRPPGPWTGL